MSQGDTTPTTEHGQAVIDAAIAYVESLTAPPLVGVPSREQPWVRARTRLVGAVEAYRQGESADA